MTAQTLANIVAGGLFLIGLLMVGLLVDLFRHEMRVVRERQEQQRADDARHATELRAHLHKPH